MSKKRKETPISKSSEDLISISIPLQGKELQAAEVTIIPRGVKPKVTDKKEPLNKTPRSYFKTAAKLVGRDRGPDLFTSTDGIEIIQELARKDVMSRNTAILGHWILNKIAESKEDTLVIRNLAELSDTLNNSNYEIKTYLLNLGGYTWPIVDSQGGELTITVEQLFHVQFAYHSSIANQYEAGELSSVRRGGLVIIKNKPFKEIRITPNKKFMEAIRGKGLKYVFTTSKFLELSLRLSEIAFKILYLTASNRPKHDIGEDKLITQLGLERLVKSQGKPRVRKMLLQALDELREEGHIKEYAYEEDRNIFRFTYSRKYVKHADGREEDN